MDPKRPLVIAEIALSHDGSLGMAHAFLGNVEAARADLERALALGLPPPAAEMANDILAELG